MADNSHEIDEAPQLKPINIFETKETIINKTKADYTITQNSMKSFKQQSRNSDRNINRFHNAVTENEFQNKTAQYYFHCRNCLLIISFENKLEIQYSKCIKVSNKYKTVSSNTQEEIFKDGDLQFKFLYCKQCNLLLGAAYELPNTPNENSDIISLDNDDDFIYNDSDDFYTNTNNNIINTNGNNTIENESKENEMKYILLKKKIKIKQSKELLCNIIGLKNELLLTFKENLNLIINNGIYLYENKTQDSKRKFSFPIVKFVINKETKTTLNEYIPKKCQNDINIIVHKIEGRLFLLGKNGYYNTLIDNLNSKYHNNVYFILVIKELEDADKEDSISHILDELILKGGQERLEYYRKHNKILFVNDFNLEEDVQNIAKVFKDLMNSRYENFEDEQYSNEKDFCEESNVDKDKELLKKIVGYEINGGNNIFSKCNML